MKNKKCFTTVSFLLLFATAKQTYAQTDTITLNQAIEAAMQNNRILSISRMQVEHNKEKVKEVGIKKYPSMLLNSTYLYNVNTSNPLPQALQM